MIYTMDKVAAAYGAALEILEMEKESAVSAPLKASQALRLGRRVAKKPSVPSGAGGLWTQLKSKATQAAAR